MLQVKQGASRASEVISDELRPLNQHRDEWAATTTQAQRATYGGQFDHAAPHGSNGTVVSIPCLQNCETNCPEEYDPLAEMLVDSG